MLLSDGDMRTYITSGVIGIEPFQPGLIQPSSLDMRLGEDFRIMTVSHEPIDTADMHDATWHIRCKIGDSYTLQPGQFLLAQTLEKVTLPSHVAAKLEGKSSLGRLGLLLHATAGWIDPGFSGTVTLELALASPRALIIYPGMKIGQMCFFTLTSPAERPYGSAGVGSRYQNQVGPTASRYGM